MRYRDTLTDSCMIEMTTLMKPCDRQKDDRLEVIRLEVMSQLMQCLDTNANDPIIELMETMKYLTLGTKPVAAQSSSYQVPSPTGNAVNCIT